MEETDALLTDFHDALAAVYDAGVELDEEPHPPNSMLLTISQARAVADGGDPIPIVMPQEHLGVSELKPDDWMFEQRGDDGRGHVGYFGSVDGRDQSPATSGSGSDEWWLAGPELNRWLRKETKRLRRMLTKDSPKKKPLSKMRLDFIRSQCYELGQDLIRGRVAATVTLHGSPLDAAGMSLTAGYNCRPGDLIARYIVRLYCESTHAPTPYSVASNIRHNGEACFWDMDPEQSAPSTGRQWLGSRPLETHRSQIYIPKRSSGWDKKKLLSHGPHVHLEVEGCASAGEHKKHTLMFVPPFAHLANEPALRTDANSRFYAPLKPMNRNAEPLTQKEVHGHLKTDTPVYWIIYLQCTKAIRRGRPVQLCYSTEDGDGGDQYQGNRVDQHGNKYSACR